ncbi:hypothetical protein DFH06DRAFT_1323393 [Mycena polygramma]|nr:hypothetical protein DFH06DRAFT_1323393 [Mycena polygramma]
MSYPILIRSRPCVPYVLGYSLNQEQMHRLAKSLCTPEQLSRHPDYPEFALNKEADGGLYFLWVKGVIPSFNEQKPKIRVPPVDFNVYPELHGLGPEVKGRCIVWPHYFALPDWFRPRLTRYALKWEKKKHWQRQREVEKQSQKLY